MAAASGIGGPPPVRNMDPRPGREAVRVDIRSLIPGKRYTFYFTPDVASRKNLYKFRATFNRIYDVPRAGGTVDTRISLTQIRESVDLNGALAPDMVAHDVPIDYIDFVTEISFSVPDDVSGIIGSFFGGKKRRRIKKSKTQKAGRRYRGSVKRIKRSKH